MMKHKYQPSILFWMGKNQIEQIPIVFFSCYPLAVWRGIFLCNGLQC